jgi:hypothetical protein
MPQLDELRGIAMPVESIHHLIACAFILMWVMIGQITMRRRSPADKQPIRRRFG